MTCDTSDITLSFSFLSSGLLWLSAFRLPFSQVGKEKGKFPFKLAEPLTQGVAFPTCAYQSHHCCFHTAIRNRETCLVLSPKRRQNGRQCPPGVWRKASCFLRGSNQSSSLLETSKGILTGTLALALAWGSGHLAGGPGPLLNLPFIFPAWAPSNIRIYRNSAARLIY